MASYVSPLASSTAGIEFTRFPSDEIKRISVKRIHVTPALDSMLGPVPGGLHDPALGAIQALDLNCSTCSLNSVYCAGHCGHIELPVPCYHPQYLDTALRLLRAKCIYCHRFRTTKDYINRVTCELRLLEHGLIEEYGRLRKMALGRRRRTRGADEDGEVQMNDSEAEEDVEDLMERRIKFVTKVVRRARKRDQNDRLELIRNPVAIATRKAVITDFLREVALFKKCSHCQGFTPSYRKDRNVKIFKRPLPTRAKDAMRIAGMKAPNPLIFLLSERQQKAEAQKPWTNGWSKEHLSANGTLGDDTHGAEEEIALRNALETVAESKLAEMEDETETQAYMSSNEVHAALTLLFEREQDVLSLVYAHRSNKKREAVSADVFFMTAVLVPPNRYRPLARQGANQMLEAQQNSALNRIVKASSDLRQIMIDMKRAKTDTSVRARSYVESNNAAVALQETVNALIDQEPNPATGSAAQRGIKQDLEKKEGLFRMHMMGKRVNFAARSVISPDPNIETNEIGVPLVFARKLTYPEPVTSHNFEEMSKAVINGMDKYPGASAIENENGMVLSLKRKTLDQRKALAKQLLTTTVPGAKGDQCKKVYRHLQSGDVVVMNRQPTLHKPSMMGHRARVLMNEKTIRMHYANCNTYNADFDGDEMNMHFPQNELARTEALQIADTDHQYLSATAGKPLRGLIQDHISMGVQFTSRDTFFDREQYQQLLYNCIRPEDYNTVFEKILTVQPAILKPKMLWSGKQVITTILKNITPDRFRGVNLTGKSSTSSEQWGETTTKDPAKFDVKKGKVIFRDTEQVVIFQDGEHLCGILDKSQLGPTAGGLIHSVYEIYGHITAGKLLSIIGRLLTRFLNERAWTCGMDDLYLTTEGDNKRRQELSKSKKLGFEVAAKHVSLKPDDIEQDSPVLNARLEGVLRNDNQLNDLDQVYNSQTKKITEDVSKACLPAGLRKPFPRNQMQAMTLSGAKGSNVNANLISSNLGQQVLEGRRVPIMVSGKSLPSFRAFETDPMAGGYVSGRFLTGIKPQEYFFHAMSGREGLIDTAVKTAKSGYLQRCIVKGLEGLKTEYDTSVRDASNGSVIQFLYGEDGLEVTKQKHLKEFSFLAANFQSVATLLRAEEVLPRISQLELGDEQKDILKSIRKGRVRDPITTIYPPANNFGSTSETFANALSQYLKENPERLIKDKKTNPGGKMSKKTFQSIMDLKYMRSVVEAGEAVGVVAAQSVGEPSTQMTLNTFHLAGHSAKNVTLGIPRLREIIMTASANLSTPTMTVKPIEELPIDDGVKFAKSISKLSLAHVLSKLTVIERAVEHEKLYDIRMEFFDADEYEQEYAIQPADVRKAIENKFMRLLDKMIKEDFKKKAREATLSETSAAVPDVGASVGRVEEARPSGTQTNEREGGEEDIDEDADPDDAKDAATRGRREDTFDEPDDDERAIAETSSVEESSDDEENRSGRKKSRAKEQPPQTLREQDPDDEEVDDDMSEEADSETENRENDLKSSFPHVQRYIWKGKVGKACKIVLSYDTKTPKLLLLPLLEKCVHASVIQSIPGLGVCTQFMEEVRTPDGKPVRIMNEATGMEEDVKEPVITTEGVNLLAMRDYQEFINPHTVYTNSVHDMLKYYGVEAARMTIVKEIDTVFKGHGISVDHRHLNLIADAMTQSGSYMSFSRNGIVKEGGSMLAKMSFETVMGFLKEAVLFGDSDPLLGPSARIVAGRRGNIGTGSFDVVMPVQ